MSDPFDLARFVTAQEPIYDQALRELRAGRKTSHWMWFVFPQLDLGRSPTAKRFAISGRAEARAYLDHPVLGARLRECVEAINALDGRSAREIFERDDSKLRSSLTLFGTVAPDEPSFATALEKYFGGRPDRTTLQLLGP